MLTDVFMWNNGDCLIFFNAENTDTEFHMFHCNTNRCKCFKHLDNFKNLEVCIQSSDKDFVTEQKPSFWNSFTYLYGYTNKPWLPCCFGRECLCRGYSRECREHRSTGWTSGGGSHEPQVMGTRGSDIRNVRSGWTRGQESTTARTLRCASRRWGDRAWARASWRRRARVGVRRGRWRPRTRSIRDASCGCACKSEIAVITFIEGSWKQ